jgi:hypothetical protein
MNKLEFESVLYKESVKALYILCRGSEDIITFEECMEHFVRFRPIASNIQFMKYGFNKKNNYEITFVFSPDYMFDNDSITICHYLNYLTWKLVLPKYDYDDDEEKVSTWLPKGKIKIFKNSFPIEVIQSLDYGVFTETFIKNSQ